MKKKLLAAVLCVALALSCFAFTACSKDDDKLNVVGISEETYTTAEDAVRAYVKLELGAEDEEMEAYFSATYVSHESKGTVKADDTDLSDADKTDLSSIEKISASITLKSVTGVNKENGEPITATEDVKQTMYVLKYGETYRYAVATPVKGECITRSYVMSLLKAEKYENCEFEAVAEGKKGEVQLYYSKIMAQLTKDAIYSKYFSDKTRAESGTLGWNGEDDDDEGDTEEYYYVEDNKLVNVYKFYGRENPEWLKDSEEDGTLAEFIDSYIGETMEMVLYVPFVSKATKNGFEGMLYGEGSSTIVVTVKDGKVTKMVGESSYESKDENDQPVTETQSQTIEISKFGKASVTVPADLKAMEETDY